MTSSPKAKKPVGFEVSVTELETLVKTLEQGELTLEEALSLFEKGLSLANHCQDTLQKAELKVTKLLQQSAQTLEEVPFDTWKDASE